MIECDYSVSATERFRVQPFYFKSYDRIIGIARNTTELHKELTRLAEVDPAALEYHIREGHIAQWLAYANETELAKELKAVKSIEQAQIRVGKHLESSKSAGVKEPATITHEDKRRNIGKRKKSGKGLQKSM